MTRIINKYGVLGLLLCIGACGDVSQEQQNNAAAATADQSAVKQQAVPPPAAGSETNLSGQNVTAAPRQFGNIGKIVSAQTVGGYSYLEVENPAGNFWLAASVAEVKAGDLVRWSDYAVMKEFHSKALDKTFEEILFVSQVLPYQESVQASQGKVLTVSDTAGYSYIEAETDNGVIWVAAPAGEIKSGDVVAWSGATEMKNFFSKSLKRNFDSILFVAAVELVK